jgi:hypothetical protein
LTLKSENDPRLAYYLTAERADGFLKALEDYRDSGEGQFFQHVEDDDIVQGDAVGTFLMYSLQRGTHKPVLGIALSNSCDISRENRRDLPVNITFAPLVAMSSMVARFKEAGLAEAAITSKVQAIKKQHVTDLFYLPQHEENGERVAILSQAQSMPIEMLYESSPIVRLRLSMLGFYLLLFKLTVHFCRMHEEIDRVI